MFKSESKLKLLDLIDINVLNEFQESFSNATGLATIIVDEDGNSTKPTNFTTFCMKHTRQTEKGLARCEDSDVRWGKIAASKGEPVIYTCHAGLTDFAVPIIVGDRHIGSILCGQVLTEEPDEDKFRKYAKELGINPDEYIKSLRELKIIPMENLKAAANLLYVVAKTISETAHKNLKLIAKNKRELLYRSIIDAIRSTLDVDETKYKIVSILGKTLSADRCFIVEYDRTRDKFLPIVDEYLSSDEISSYSGVDVNVDIPNFAEALKQGKPLIIKNKEIFIDVKDTDFNPEKRAIEKNNVYSAYAVPLYYNKEFLGVLSIHYVEYLHEVGEDEISLMSVIANQVAIALYQTRLYAKTKENIEREKFIGDIISKSLTTLDLNQIKQIVRDVGTRMRADRCYFVEVDYMSFRGKQIGYDGEYLASSDIKSILDYEFLTDDVRDFLELFYKSKELILFDYEKLREENSSEAQKLIDYANWSNLKSGIGIPFFNNENLVAVLAVEYVKERVIPTQEELDFLKILGNQTAMAYSQILLYQSTKKKAEREKLLRKIFESMGKTLDLETIKKDIVNALGKNFDADRCFILTYLPDSSDFVFEENAEYLSGYDIKSLRSYDHSTVKWFVDAFSKGEEIDFDDLEVFLDKHNLRGAPEEQFFRKFDIKSAYHFAINYANKLQGYLILEYVRKSNTLKDEDLEFLRTVTVQAGIAFYQSQLYLITKAQAENEKFRRNIIEIMRSSLDRHTIKLLFVRNIGKYFNADRVFFSDYDDKTKQYLPVEEGAEYLSGPNVMSFIGYDWTVPEAREYIQPLLEKRELKIPCWDEYSEKSKKGQDFINLFENSHTVSSYNIPVLYQQKIMGYFCIEYTRGTCFKLPEDDVNTIRNICAQAGIALYHADLISNLKNSVTFKKDFIESLSDEMAKPLTEMVDYTNILINQKVDLEIQIDIIEKINSRSVLLQDIRDNIVSISRLESDDFKLEYDTINSKDSIDSVLYELKPKIDEKNIKLDLNIQENFIKVDDIRFDMLLNRLFSQFLKILPPNGCMSIYSGLELNKFELAVSIPLRCADIPSHNKIFESFKQIDSNYIRIKKGLDLSLILIKKIVDLHNGVIRVDSMEDKGVRVSIFIPM